MSLYLSKLYRHCVAIVFWRRVTLDSRRGVLEAEAIASCIRLSDREDGEDR